MEARGLTSYRRLGEKAKISHEAVRRVVLGMASDDASIEAVARALSVDVELVREMRGEPAIDPGRWSPPAGSRLLTDDERAALSRLIGVMVAGRQGREGENGGDTAATKTPPDDGGDVLEFKHPADPKWSPEIEAEMEQQRAAYPLEGETELQRLRRIQDEQAERGDT